MSRLDHPNIVRVYGGRLRPPDLFTVAELMVRDLASHLHRKGASKAPSSHAAPKHSSSKVDVAAVAAQAGGAASSEGCPPTLQSSLAIALDIINGLVSHQVF